VTRRPSSKFLSRKLVALGNSYIYRNIQIAAWGADPAVLISICPHNLVIQNTNYKLKAMDGRKDDIQTYL
jgi:hypothetical protein